jgi:hypothetical protein
MRNVLLLTLLMAGCSTVVPEGDCRTDSWYALGERDALAGLQPQIDRYTKDCSEYAVKPPESDYMAGWQLGYSEYQLRTSRSRM